MKYASVKDLRSYLGFYPIKVEGELLGRGDGSTRAFYTQYKPLVDFDYDGQIIDDVVVKVDGSPAEVEAVDELTGRIMLVEAPPQGAQVVVDYYWHPFGDRELQAAIEAAEAEIDNECGRSFEKKEHVERFLLTRGNKFAVTNTPLISVSYIRIYTPGLEFIEELPPSDYIFSPNGIIELKKYYAGVPVKPWYLPLQILIEVKYVGGYDPIPAIVSHTATLIAAYHLLLKISSLMATEPEYQGKVALAFRKPEEITKRLEYLKAEIEDLKRKLPHRVVMI